LQPITAPPAAAPAPAPSGDAPQVRSFSLKALAVALVLNSAPPEGRKVAIATLVLCLAEVALPFILYAYYHDYEGFDTSATIIIARVCAFASSFFYHFVLMQFLAVGVIDYRRRQMVLERLTRLTQNTVLVGGVVQSTNSYRPAPAGSRSLRVVAEGSAEEEDDGDAEGGGGGGGGGSGGGAAAAPSLLQRVAGQVRSRLQNLRDRARRPSRSVALLPPVIDMSRTSNAFAWYRLRIMAQDMGLVYHTRLQVYVTLCLLVVLYIDLQAVVRVARGEGLLKDVDFDLLYLVAIINSAVVFLALIGMVFAGAAANDQLAEQEEAFINAAVDIEEIMRDVTVLLQRPTGGSALGGASVASDASMRRGAGGAGVFVVPPEIAASALGQRVRMCVSRAHASALASLPAAEADVLLRDLRSAVSALGTIQQALRVHDDVRPIQVLGLRASTGLLRAIATGAASLAGVLTAPTGANTSAVTG
jgi:hypothetical protein